MDEMNRGFDASQQPEVMPQQMVSPERSAEPQMPMPPYPPQPPYGTPPQNGVPYLYYYPYPPYMQPPVQKGRNGFAIASLVLGIFSIVCCLMFPIAIILAILSLIFAVVAKKKGNGGLSTAGLVLGIIGLVLGILILVILLFGEFLFTTFYLHNNYWGKEFHTSLFR